jgi:hypothetical protein
MNKYFQLQKIIAIITIFIILVSLSGCYTSKAISISDLPVTGNSPYIIRNGKSKYQIINPVFTNSSISGELRLYNSRSGSKIYLYPKQDSTFFLHEESYSTFNSDNIVKVESKKVNVFLTTVTVIAAIIVLTPLKYFLLGGYDM